MRGLAYLALCTVAVAGCGSSSSTSTSSSSTSTSSNEFLNGVERGIEEGHAGAPQTPPVATTSAPQENTAPPANIPPTTESSQSVTEEREKQAQVEHENAEGTRSVREREEAEDAHREREREERELNGENP
jgi:hypothetical protein